MVKQYKTIAVEKEVYDLIMIHCQEEYKSNKNIPDDIKVNNSVLLRNMAKYYLK